MGTKTKYLSVYETLSQTYSDVYIDEIPQSVSFQSSNVLILIELLDLVPTDEKDVNSEEDVINLRVHIMNKDYKIAFETALDVRDILNEYNDICHFENMVNFDDEELEIKRFVIDFKIM